MGAALLTALAATGIAAPAASATAQAQPSLKVRVAATTPGQVSATVRAPRGTVVTVREPGAATPPLVRTLKRERLKLPRVAPWDCARRDRSFVFDLALPAGAAPAQVTRSVRTPGCARRLAVRITPARAGQQLRATVTDRFGLGGMTARVCAKGPAGPQRCADATLAAGKRSATARLGRARAGRTVVTLTNPWGAERRATLTARSASSGFRLLATGDSMIQIIDSYLDQRLGSRKGRVTSDAHISTGISKPAMLNWTRHARGSASSVKPDVTVVFLGANDGFPMNGVACCGDAWSRIYAGRVEAMMRSYLRGGRGRVIWLTLPAPRGGNFATVFRGVNEAILLAASRFRDDQVTVLDLRKTFTPGGAYRGSIRWNGQTRQVRQSDGVHLNTAGASIAAELIIRQLRRDGFVG